jgi:hypothetical protein
LDSEYTLPQQHDTCLMTLASRFGTSGYPNEVELGLLKPLQARHQILTQGREMPVERRSGDGRREHNKDHTNKNIYFILLNCL